MSELTKRFQQSYAREKARAITNAESGLRMSFAERVWHEETLQRMERALATREVRESKAAPEGE